jgi:hypothetical protein
MKSIIYIAFFVLTSVGIYAQEINQQELAQNTKETATKISQELNFDDNESLYLYRAIYSTERTKLKAKQQLGDSAEQLQEMNQKINDQFIKMLSAKFDTSEIASIKQMMNKE